MNYLPSYEKVKEIAKSGEYDILPVSCEILSDICTPIEALRILKNVSSHCYILESVVGNEKWGRYTFLGFDPKLEIVCSDSKMKIVKKYGKDTVESVGKYVKSIKDAIRL